MLAFIEAEMKETFVELNNQNLENMKELTRMINDQNAILSDMKAEIKSEIAEMRVIIFGASGDPNGTGILSRCREHADQLEKITEVLRGKAIDKVAEKERIAGMQVGVREAEVVDAEKKQFKWQAWQVWGLILGEPLVTAALAVVVSLLMGHH